jgi:hypothetical protein
MFVTYTCGEYSPLSYAKRNSLRTGDPENSGFSKMQLLELLVGRTTSDNKNKGTSARI